MKTSHLKNFNIFTPEILSITWRDKNSYLRRLRRAAGLFLFTLLLLACGQEESGDSGGYRANLVFPEDIQRLADASGIDCSAANIDTIVFNFIANEVQHGPYDFACNDHTAMMTGVPAGTGITVEVFADDIHGNAVLEGFEVIDIPKDQVVTGGPIRMQYVSSEPPTAMETEVADFDGTWTIHSSPYGEQELCFLYTRDLDYSSVIVQKGTNATIKTMIDICPDEIDSQCTVNGNVLRCNPFNFIDNEGRTHNYTELYLTYVSNNLIIGENSWGIFGEAGNPLCSGISSLIGNLEESADEIEE